MTAPPLTEIIAAWRAIPELVTEMGGDPSRIYAHEHGYMSSVERAAYSENANAPSVLLVWTGKLGRMHNFEIYIQPDPDRSLMDLLVLLESGTPVAVTDGLPILWAQFHPNFDPMTTGISFSMRSVYVDPGKPGLDYWVGNFSLGERGIYA